MTKQLENYYPNERKYRSSIIGEIKLDRSIHRLSSSYIGGITTRQSSLPLPIKIEINASVTEFLEIAKAPLKKKIDFRYCLRRSLHDLSALKQPLAKINDLSTYITSTPYAYPNSRRFLKACKTQNIIELQAYLDESPFLVYSLDELQMTGLH